MRRDVQITQVYHCLDARSQVNLGRVQKKAAYNFSTSYAY